MRNKILVKIMAAMAAVVLGTSFGAIAYADGFYSDPCSNCGGSIWITETSYERLEDTRVCTHGYTKGTDCYYAYITNYFYDCLDCDKVIGNQDFVMNYSWRCEGYN